MSGGVELCGPSVSDFDVRKCIICQKDTNISLSSTAIGRKRIIEASKIRYDIVSKRLKCTTDDKFYYHVSNECYKYYTHSKSLQMLENKRSRIPPPAADPEPSSSHPSPAKRRSMAIKRNPPTPKCDRFSHKETICVICGIKKKGGKVEKFRISETGRADRFLKVTTTLQDKVYERTCDLMDINSVFGADLYCHKNCIRSYLRTELPTPGPSDFARASKLELWASFTDDLRPGFNSGDGFPLSDITNKFNEILAAHQCRPVSNKEIKLLLIDSFGDQISFSQPKQRNKSLMVLGPAVSREELADKIRSQNLMVESGKRLREALKKCDFDLHDKFCDSTELDGAWEHMDMPDDVLNFFAGVFSFSPKSYGQASSEMLNQVEEDEESQTRKMDSALSVQRCREIQSIFQIFFYCLNNGRKRTPMHVMLGEIIHSTCRSSSVMTILNRFGLCISYDELRRYHTDMAKYTIESSKCDVPLPSNFDPDVYTIGGMDNFDHEEASASGIGGTHDSVAILLQDRFMNSKNCKPNISETSVVHGEKTLKSVLSCQRIREFHKPSKKPDLPSDYKVAADLYEWEKKEKDEILCKDMIWSLSRMGTDDDGRPTWRCPEQSVPTWSATNSVWTYEELPRKSIGFLPVLPYPITEYSSVYTLMKNFQCVVSQLKQNEIPVFCYEGVYHIAKEIQLIRQDEFSNVVLMLGSFHMIRVVLGCIGKYLAGSGAESIWIESKAFGMNVVESVLNGKNYSRSLKGISQMAECMQRLQLTEFFHTKNLDTYKNLFAQIENIKAMLINRESEKSRELLKEMDLADFLTEYEEFVRDGRRKSENFLYWDNFLRLFNLLRNLIRSDREGNWPLHLDTVQSLLPVFAVFDATNYLRWASLYLEDMRKLPEITPDVHEEFLQGGFVVKRTAGHFKAIGVDMCLEQTINKSQKSAGGIIGATKLKKFVAEWEIIHHEMLSVTNLLRHIGGICHDYELSINHEFSDLETINSENNIEAMISFISEHGNPFAEGDDSKLHNIVTKELMNDTIRTQLLNVLEAGTEKYQNLRNKRFLEKSVRISEKIQRTNLKTFKNIRDNEAPKRKSDGTKVMSKKELAHAQRIMEIARARGHTMNFLLQYDIVPSADLFDSSGLITKATKADLIKEMEKYLSDSDYSKPEEWPELDTAVIVDVMACLRKVRTKNVLNFQELVKVFVSMTLNCIANPTRVDYVFDSYFEQSIKESERERRASQTPIELTSVSGDRSLPADMNKFWPSASNKTKLQAYIKSHLADVPSECQIVTSQLVGLEPCVTNGKEIPELNFDNIEEADMRIIPHTQHAARRGATRVLVISGDTDVIVLLLHYWPEFKVHGLQELWAKAGSQDKIRYIPIHLLAEKLGPKLCSVLPALHVITGCDYTSKFGTKSAALKAEPEQFLMDFGSSASLLELPDTCNRAERFLVRLLKKDDSCQTMNEYRAFLYHHKKNATLAELPPSSSSLQQHILRSFYVVNKLTTILERHAIKLTPTDFGYDMADDIILPCHGLKLLPEKYAVSCNCGKCATSRCTCRGHELSCCEFCNCQKTGSCQNPVR